MRLKLLASLLSTLPVAALAVGSDSGSGGTAPTETPTSQQCADGHVFDEKRGECRPAQQGSLDDDTLYRAVRELAYAGRYDSALMVIAAMSDEAQRSDRVLTYLGFVHRKSGDVEKGLGFYRAALSKNPDNILARSYLGQHLVETGDLVAAARQLREIRARGGQGSWAEVALLKAIESGTGTNY